LANAPKLLGPNGLSGDPVACAAKQTSAFGAGPDGPKSEENSFLNKKIEFLNIPRLWKFVQGDLG
jgi:hypothetical protein